MSEQTLMRIYRESRSLARLLYLRKGFVPSRLRSIISCAEALLEITREIKNKTERERVPAGTFDGGEYAPGGGDKHPGGSNSLRKAPDKATQKRAKAIYGETSGLTPKLKDSKLSPYNRSNWDSTSAKDLATARTYIGIVSERNPDVNYAAPSDANNPIEAQTWNDAVNAAIDGHDSTQLPPNVTNFFLRQDGTGRQTPPWDGLHQYYSLGPFNNVGGGDVPKGPNTYIDFYGK